MRVRISRKLGVLALLVALGLSVGLLATAQQPAKAGGRPAVDDNLRIDHFLPATLDPAADVTNPFTDPTLSGSTVQWGWLDPLIPPKLVVNSGDNVAVETMLHSHNQIVPGTSMDRIVQLRLANPGGGPHTVTGPIFVNGAEPGDVMEIRIKRIVTKGVGFNFNLPGGPASPFRNIGALNDQERFADGFVRYFFFEPDKRRTEFKPGITVDLKPFPGVLAVGIDPTDRSNRRNRLTNRPDVVVDPSVGSLDPVSTLRPWKNGSNMDLNELVEGSTIFIPVFLRGGLVWTGDSHCRQGNGEINLTALECSYDHVVIQPIVRKDMHLEWPMVETKTHWIFLGFADGTETNVPGTGALDKAFRIAANNMVDFLTTQGLTAPEAYSLSSIVGDCRVTQVVDIRRGVHCMVPKKIFSKAQSS